MIAVDAVKVLVVDDQPEFRKLILQSLASSEFVPVGEAGDAMAALRKLSARSFRRCGSW